MGERNTATTPDKFLDVAQSKMEKAKQERAESFRNQDALNELLALLPTLEGIGKLDLKLKAFADYVTKHSQDPQEEKPGVFFVMNELEQAMARVSKYVRGISDVDYALASNPDPDVVQIIGDLQHEYRGAKYNAQSDLPYAEELRRNAITRLSRKLEEFLDDFLKRKANAQPRLQRWMHGGAINALKRKEPKE